MAEIVHEVLPVHDESQLVERRDSARASSRHLPVLRVVVGHQDRDRVLRAHAWTKGASALPFVSPFEDAIGGSSSCRSGSVTVKVEPSSGLALRRDRATVALGDPAAQREPDAGTGVFAVPVEALEDTEYPRGVPGLEADAVVGNGDLGGVAANLAVDADDGRHAVAPELDPVGHEVLDQLPHPDRIGGDGGQIAHLDGRARLPHHHVEIRRHLTRDLAQVDLLGGTGVRRDPGEREQAVDQRLHSPGGVVHPLEVVAALVRQALLLRELELLGERLDLAQGLLEIVRGDRGEALERLVRTGQLAGTPLERLVGVGQLAS